MNECNEKTINLLSHNSIVERAMNRWNSKTSTEKIRSSHKYKHIFEKLNIPSVNWDTEFSKLSKRQASILIKGELIRSYDSMPNIDKTKIKNKFGLSTFSSKWFRLPPTDKKILLNSVLNNGKK
jgi:hypothetical protein